MFKQAVRQHEATAGRPKALEQQLFPSSSPIQQQLQPSITTARYPNARPSHVLRPASANAPLKEKLPGPPANSAVKRTHSGLAKVVSDHGSFEEPYKPSNRANPIVIDENFPIATQAPKLTQCEYFDEGDFDSDIDLDVEDPTTKQSVSYPSLPKAPSPKPFSYPALPKQQLRQIQDRDSGYGGSGQTVTRAVTGPPNSSAGISWPSSPPENHRTPPKANHFKQFAYTGQPDLDTKNAQPLPAAAKAPPPKRRTIPWLEEDSQTAQAEQNGPLLSRETSTASRSTVEFTPLPKNSKKDAHPWNTTASALKEQQKSLREVNKKKSKSNEATDDGLIGAKKKKSRDSVARVFLSEEQQHVLELVSEHKKSVFFTGSAGTGKSVLLREIIATLRAKHLREPDRVAVTASTGLAACNIGGVTLHSFAGIGLGKEDVPELVKKIRRNQKAKHRWMRTKILVMDEVSMVDGDLFDKLEAIARSIRNNGRPFGGIQLVITGDFFQLPPVPDYGKVSKFAFDAGAWNTSIEHTIGLHHVFRQKDPVFAGMLNEMREGRLTPASISQFQKLSRPIDSNDGFQATELFPTRNEVENANNMRMRGLVGDTKIFEARDGGTIADKAQRDKLLSNCMAPEAIHLKKGAQVMLIKNIDESLVNGSLGKVIGFMSELQFDAYHDNEENFIASQGGTIADGSTPGNSKASTSDAATKKAAASRIMDNLLGSTTQTWPVVRFALADGTTRDLLCQRETWKVELPNGEVQASRAQIPLILAWALSIHKAQGQTLERVKVDLGKVFEKGQAYVALSRATNMAGLQVLRFDPKKVVAHEKVRTFYGNLSRVEAIQSKGGKGEDAAKKRKAGIAAEDYERSYMDGY